MGAPYRFTMMMAPSAVSIFIPFRNPCTLTVIEVVPYSEVLYDGFWSHLTPARLGVPRYQNIFRIAVWFLFLFSYSQAGSCMALASHLYVELTKFHPVREPLDKLNRDHDDLDEWEIVMYVLALAFSLEGKIDSERITRTRF